MHKTQLQTIQT